LLLSLGAAFAVHGVGATEPSVAPQITSVFPHGGRVGSTVDVTITGRHLDDASRFEFASAGIQARILSSDSRRIHAQVVISPTAETGSHEFRLFTPSGTVLGIFELGALPELSEAEPNDTPESAQNISYPVLINGTADAEDADCFRFNAHAGQVLAFDVRAARSGSSLDPVLALLDERGQQLAYNDDYYIEKDSHLEYTFARDGVYYVRVSASYSRSVPGADYRLTITDQPYAMYSIPAGSERGKPVELTLRGTNVNGIDRVWLDSENAHAAVLSRSASEVKVRIEVPRGLPPGRHRLHVACGDREAAVPLRFDISELPEITVTDQSASDATHPVLLRAPMVVNAEIGAKGEDYLHRSHTYEFDAPEGARYEFQVHSWELGLRADPVVTLFDPDGKKLAMEDDPAPNSFIHYAATHDPDLVYRFSKAGRYRVVVRDAMYRGGAGFIYRMTVRPTEPDFHVDSLTQQLTAYVGRKTSVLVQVHRTGGVHRVELFKHPDNEIENFRLIENDGWRSPVMLWADGVPPGVTAERVMAEPKNTTFKGNDGEDLFVDGTVVDIPLQVGSDAKPGLYKLHIRGESSFDGQTVTREAKVARKNRSIKIPADQQCDLYLTIVKPPAVLLTAPERLEVTKGEATHLKVSLFYFEQTGGPIVIEAKPAASGLDMGRVNVSGQGEEAEIPVSVSGDARDSETKVVMIARDPVSGRILGESAPVTVQIGSKR
jgi:hypothetical protein